MKNSTLFTTMRYSLFVLFVFLNCANLSVQTPEQIGKQTYEIVKILPTQSFDEYRAKFMSYEQLQTLEKVSPEGFQKFLAQVTREEMSSDYKRDYDKFKATIKSDAEAWKSVEFSNFSYTLDSIDGIQLCDGRLGVTSGEQTYTIRTSSIYDGNSYLLAGMKLITNK